ncbi:MAG TPA: divalent-cation tolerance protein CutA [Ktedonobacteraceae bacterium]|nr:divalent-cation tolerance protein CutA [Ktedonobacteraceae bacterium]
MTDIIEVRTTTDDREGAHQIAQALVTQRLAACAQISGPITSIYWWEGEISETDEWVCTVKTRKELYAAVEQAIRQNHTYQEPEIIAIEVGAGSASYLNWVTRETQPQS